MATKCQHCPLRSREIFRKVNSSQLSSIQRFKSGELQIDRGTQILLEGSNSPQLFTVLKGQALRYKTLENGKRQVLNFVMPGDFIGLQAALMGEMQHSVEAVTPMILCVFDRTEFFKFFAANTNIAYEVAWIAAVEEHFLGDALTSLGQRSAVERMAWALLRIFRRSRQLGLERSSNVVPLPYKQQDLADALGLSLVHTNKTLAKLRDKQLASWSDGELHVFDEEAMSELAMLDPDVPVERPMI